MICVEHLAPSRFQTNSGRSSSPGGTGSKLGFQAEWPKTSPNLGVNTKIRYWKDESSTIFLGHPEPSFYLISSGRLPCTWNRGLLLHPTGCQDGTCLQWPPLEFAPSHDRVSFCHSMASFCELLLLVVKPVFSYFLQCFLSRNRWKFQSSSQGKAFRIALRKLLCAFQDPNSPPW